MSKYRNNLPQLNGKMFLTDGGLETTLIFHHGLDLPHFACFPMIDDPIENLILEEYYENYLAISKRNKLGFILESPTFRSNPDWGFKLGYDLDVLNEINAKSIRQLLEMREKHEDEHTPIVISGCLGPRGDGYVTSSIMSVEKAKDYHKEQIQTFRGAGADMVTCFTMNYINEAYGITLAAKELEMPVVIGFTVETDGKLPSGESLQDAIEVIDAMTDNYPVYYMINCAHPTHFVHRLNQNENWISRIMAVRANASDKSHAELDECDHLDAGDKHDLAERYVELRNLLPNLKVLGGCCGTDHSHVEEICKIL